MAARKLTVCATNLRNNEEGAHNSSKTEPWKATPGTGPWCKETVFPMGSSFLSRDLLDLATKAHNSVTWGHNYFKLLCSSSHNKWCGYEPSPAAVRYPATIILYESRWRHTACVYYCQASPQLLFM